MKPLFQAVKFSKPKTNAFDLSHEKKLSCNMGELIPIYLQEIVPGDKFKVNTEMLIRFAPMLAPVMHRINAYVHYFWVPNRLLWDNWKSFITGGVNGTDAPTFPTMDYDEASRASWATGTLADYFGIPEAPAGTIVNPATVNALPFRAYQLIYNEYYMDQTQSTPAAITKNDTVAAPEKTALLTMRKRAWEKDYLTSALPWSQRGSAVNLPTTVNYSATTVYKDSAGANVPSGAATFDSGNHLLANGTATQAQNISSVDITVQNLRRAIKLQEWLEKNATGGSRYIEQILAHFGIVSKAESKLGRPEYLGGGKTPIVVSEVVSTVKEATNPQGNMSGHGIGVGNSNGFSRFFDEHGFIVGILSVLPRTAYQNGLHRMWTKADKYEYFWPELAHIGEQPIRNKEVFFSFQGTNVNDNNWGYTPRYAEYKFNPSTVHGDFRTTLNFYHMGRIFTSLPGLNQSFIEADPTNRIFAVVDSSDKLWIQLYNSVKAIRPMPVFGTPMI